MALCPSDDVIPFTRFAFPRDTFSVALSVVIVCVALLRGALGFGGFLGIGAFLAYVSSLPSSMSYA